jgi:ABC-2 type transport system permease protein
MAAKSTPLPNRRRGSPRPGNGGPRPGVTRLVAHLRLLRAYLAANLAMAMEYRVAFLAQVFGMMLNNSLWLAYWALFFHRFPVVRGWERQDVLMLWALIAVGFGLAEVLFGAWRHLARLIAEGQLDYFLVLPKSTLWHTLMSRTTATGWGDAAFGLLVFAIWGSPTLPRLLLFIPSALACGAILLGASIAYNSLAFFVGHAEALALQMENAMIHFSTYPGAIFDGLVRVLLFTVVPAGFVNHMPVNVLRDADTRFLAIAWAAAAAWVIGGQLLFTAGLRRYESGNLMGPRM